MCLDKLALRFVAQPLFFQHFGQCAMNIRQVRIEPRRFSKLFGGLRQIPAVGQGNGQIVVGTGVFRVEPQGFFILRNGLRKVFPYREGVAQIDVGLGELGP